MGATDIRSDSRTKKKYVIKCGIVSRNQFQATKPALCIVLRSKLGTLWGLQVFKQGSALCCPVFQEVFLKVFDQLQL